MLTPMLSTFMSSWMSFGGWTLLDKHRTLLNVKNPAALQFLTQTVVPGTYYLTSMYYLAHTPCNTCTIHVSIVWNLTNPSLTCLLPFSYTDWSGFSFHLDSPGQSMLWKEQVFIMFCTITVLGNGCVFVCVCARLCVQVCFSVWAAGQFHKV